MPQLEGGALDALDTLIRLLRVLARHAGRVLTHRQLLRDVWGAAYEEQTQYLRVYIGHLREKLENDPSRPRLFLTEPGVGYRLLAPEDAPKRGR